MCDRFSVPSLLAVNKACLIECEDGGPLDAVVVAVNQDSVQLLTTAVPDPAPERVTVRVGSADHTGHLLAGIAKWDPSGQITLSEVRHVGLINDRDFARGRVLLRVSYWAAGEWIACRVGDVSVSGVELFGVTGVPAGGSVMVRAHLSLDAHSAQTHTFVCHAKLIRPPSNELAGSAGFEWVDLGWGDKAMLSAAVLDSYQQTPAVN